MQACSYQLIAGFQVLVIVLLDGTWSVTHKSQKAEENEMSS